MSRKSEPWIAVEMCQYDVDLAIEKGWDLTRYQRRLDAACETAKESGIIRCEATGIDPSGTGHRCMFNAGHNSRRKKKVENIKHYHGGFTWTEAGIKRALRDIAAKKAATMKSQAKIDESNLKQIVVIPKITKHLEETKPPRRTNKQKAGDEQEVEIYQRLISIYPKLIRTNVNAMGVDLQSFPDIDIQSKAFSSVGPKDISHFADSSDALLKMFIAFSFTKQARIRATKRDVKLITMKEFRERYPI